MPVPVVNIKVKEAPVIPAGIPITVACEAMLNFLNHIILLVFDLYHL